jgi:hypothetical protein
MFVDMRKVLTESAGSTCSTMSAKVARDWMSEPPGDSKNPVRCSAIGRPKTLVRTFLFFKFEPGIIVGAKWLHIVLIDYVKIRPLFKEAVG